jgi:hypothetical protein
VAACWATTASRWAAASTAPLVAIRARTCQARFRAVGTPRRSSCRPCWSTTTDLSEGSPGAGSRKQGPVQALDTADSSRCRPTTAPCSWLRRRFVKTNIAPPREVHAAPVCCAARARMSKLRRMSCGCTHTKIRTDRRNHRLASTAASTRTSASGIDATADDGSACCRPRARSRRRQPSQWVARLVRHLHEARLHPRRQLLPVSTSTTSASAR